MKNYFSSGTPIKKMTEKGCETDKEAYDLAVALVHMFERVHDLPLTKSKKFKPKCSKNNSQHAVVNGSSKDNRLAKSPHADTSLSDEIVSFIEGEPVFREDEGEFVEDVNIKKAIKRLKESIDSNVLLKRFDIGTDETSTVDEEIDKIFGDKLT